MLRVVVSTSAAAALQYYTNGLTREDYYSEGQELIGKWHGKAATMLGLAGDVQREQFAALVENRHPGSGEKLTPRNRAGRRVGYDLNFHAPKSLSVLYALTQNKQVLAAFRQAVADTMCELEERAETRVRKQGGKGNRTTGNLAWAEFVHFTARPVGGVPDPHLHAHCFTFNATFDQVEGRWKAAEFGAIKKEAHYAEGAFHARLSASMAAMGYTILRKKGGWEIGGMPQGALDKFSRRTAEIEAKAAELGITDPKAKDALGAATRKGKRHDLTFPELLAIWGARLTAEEKAAISKACFERKDQGPAKITAKAALDYAEAKLFERQSVAPRGHILAAALRYGAGTLSPEAIKAEFERRQFIGRKIGDDHLCTTQNVLAEELALLAFVRGGRNSAMRLGGRGKLQLDATLSDEQQGAVKHILSSRDQVIAIKGAAGVGKTTLMQEAQRQIQREVCAALNGRGLKVFAFAPSAAASRETLREAGFEGADTVAQLLVNTKLQRRVRGNVIWIDEAGLLGTRDLRRILQIADSKTRIILTGDAGQHAPVPRGDPFRLLPKYTGLRVAEVNEIRRQQVEDYRQAIIAISKGDLRTGFRRLEALGAFVEIENDAERYRELALDYLALGKHGNFPLVVSPTHAEGAKVTDAIRAARHEAGQLKNERPFTQYQELRWEEVERSLPENYHSGLVVQFNQNARGIKRGEMFKVIGQGENGVEMLAANGRKALLPLAEAEKFQVFEEKAIAVAIGERIRITRNGTSQDGKRLNNGNSFTVEKFGRSGEILLSNGAVLVANHGHFTHGYCQTSLSSQSKSVRDVLVAQSKNSLVASSREQFYVSCSRGKETIRIYTDDRKALQEAVGYTSKRMAGVELANLSHKDISDFMASELGARQWREAVASRRGADGAKTFVKHLAEQRKTEPRPSGQVIDWRGYVEMRRANITADGKSRSKGYGGQPSKKQRQHAKGLSTLRPTQHTKPVRDQMAKSKEAAATKKEAPAKERKPAPKSRKERLVSAYRTAAEHFKKIADKVRGRSAQAKSEKTVKMGRATIKPSQQNNAKRAAQHAGRTKAADVNKAAEAQRKAATKTKQAAPRPVVVRK